MRDFNKEFDVNNLKDLLAETQGNSSEYPEIPVGKYEIKVIKGALKENKNGNPMCSLQFKIVEGEYKDNLLFYNQTLVGTDKDGKTNVLGLHLNNQFLTSLDSGLEIKFEEFNQYDALIEKVMFAIKDLTYLVEYTKKGDFPSYKIKEIYED